LLSVAVARAFELAEAIAKICWRLTR